MYLGWEINFKQPYTYIVRFHTLSRGKTKYFLGCHMRPINEIIIHCSATRPDWMSNQPSFAKVAEIRRWHMRDNGWKDIGYHFLIDRDGTVLRGRPLEQVGSHVRGKNNFTIGVCLLGMALVNADAVAADRVA